MSHRPSAPDHAGGDERVSAATAAIIARVRQLARANELLPGERLGSERALAESLSVARSALRGALEYLEQRGEIRRAMGRSGGVFVSDGRIERNLNTIQGVPDLLRYQGFTSSTEVIRAGLATAGPAERRHLQLGEGESVIRLLRRRDADGVPLSLDAMSLPTRLFPGWLQLDLTSSVYQLMSAHYGVEVARAEESSDVRAASPEEAAILGIGTGDPLLQVWRTTWDADERPVEFAHDLFRADRTRITMRRYGARWKRAD
jgi:GntR family transcriptional regulator